MQKTFILIAALGGLTAVVFGAFGAHGLKSLITPEQLVIWEKGVQYQFYHSLAIFMCALYLRMEYSAHIRNAIICFGIGILCFSGSLYLLSTASITHIPAMVLGPVTPIGGLFFIAGWGLIALHALRSPNSN